MSRAFSRVTSGGRAVDVIQCVILFIYACTYVLASLSLMRLAFHSLPPKGLGSHLHIGVSLDGLDLCSVFLVMLVCAFIPLLVVL